MKKMTRSPFVAAMILGVGLGAGCDYQRRSSSIAPSSTTGPTASTYVGTWSSQNVVNDLPPALQGCANFQWNVTAKSSDAIGGTFTATCTAGVTISGNGTGQLQGDILAISMTGTANVAGLMCNFTLTGTGHYDGDRITVPYAGTSCYGPFSGVETLRRGSLPGPTPPPTSPPPPPPPPGAGICAFNNGPEIVACVEARYPERLAAGVSLETRQANMMFLRDRIIEGGLCGGMDLGWNLKRGGPEISIDFLVWRRNGVDVGIDIGQAYDDTSRTLRLQWLESTFPFYLAYPPPTCG
jgi:hypothetical protein